MTNKIYEFEKYPRLREIMLRCYRRGLSLMSWGQLCQEINTALIEAAATPAADAVDTEKQELIKALRFYADDGNYELQHNTPGWGMSKPIIEDFGHRAREVLTKFNQPTVQGGHASEATDILASFQQKMEHINRQLESYNSLHYEILCQAESISRRWLTDYSKNDCDKCAREIHDLVVQHMGNDGPLGRVTSPVSVGEVPTREDGIVGGPSVSLWQPIETAPKDGTPILLARYESCGDLTWMATAEWGYTPLKYIRGGFSGWRIMAPSTINAINPKKESMPFGEYIGPIFCPTHWMQLPQPPERK